MVDFKDLPKDKRVELIKSRRPKEPPKNTAEDKLSEAIDSLNLVLQKAINKPDIDLKMTHKILSTIMEGLNEIKKSMPLEKQDTWSNITVTRKGELGSGKYTIEKVK